MIGMYDKWNSEKSAVFLTFRHNITFDVFT